MSIQDIVKELGIEVSSVNTTSHELYCICPFHDGESPNFNVNYITGKWRCWAASCDRKGRSINDLSVQLNGKKYFLDGEHWLSSYKKKLYPVPIKERVPSIPILPLALKNEGEKFLTKRGITKESIIKWNLLHWANIDAVVIPAEKVGYIIRYMHPTNPKDKYKYVSGTKITNCLFGESQLSHKNWKFTILVEGSLDAIALHQKGFDNALGILHAELSDTQVGILRNYQYPVYLMLDPDIGGVNGSIKIFNKLRNEFFVKICTLPQGKDPDQCSVDEILASLTNARRWCII